MPLAITEGNWLAANMALMSCLLFFQVVAMIMLGFVLASALRNRSGLDEETLIVEAHLSAD